MHRKIIIGLILLSFIQLTAKTATTESIKKLMELNGEMANGKFMVTQMINNALPILKTMAPDAPESFWTEVKNNAPIAELLNAMIPIYQKHFNEKDILELIQFYKTAIGKKIILKQPMVFKDSMSAGHQIGKQYGIKIMQEYNMKYKK